MDYRNVKLESELHGLSVREPEGYEDLAIIGNLDNNYDTDNLRPILEELKEMNRNRLIFDLSKYPDSSRNNWMAFLDGIVIGNYGRSQSGFRTRYVGVEELGIGWLYRFKDKVSIDLENAVQSISN
ncbi:MAG: hypothetical protein AABW91_02140 [Nanoarchaeota archaeon]